VDSTTLRVVSQQRPGYVFDTTWAHERERLAANERYWDPFSIRILEQFGIADGMRVLDVGAGGGTIAQWFARRVAPSGSVLAVDLDPRFLLAVDEPNLEARQLDLFADDFPQDSFDVVHARCLLEHLPERVRGLERLIGAARPGGLVTVCDFGGELGGPVEPTPDDLLAQEAFFAVVNQAGWDHTWAPMIAEHMRQLGLEDVDAESFRRYSVGGDTGSVRINQFSINQLRDRMVATGRVTTHQIDACIARLRDPAVGHLSFETWYAWGRRPAKDSSESTDN
jgi:SAM-dependent methyltransferase